MQQKVLANIGPFSTLGFRCLLALLVIVPFLKMGRLTNCKVDREGQAIGVITVVFFLLAMITQQIGFRYTSVTNVGFIVGLTTVLTPFFAWVCLSQRPTPAIIPAMVASLIGAYLMSAGALPGLNVGDLSCLISAVFFSLWMVFLGLFVCRYKNVAALTLAQLLVSGLFCTVIGLVFEKFTLSGFMIALPNLIFVGLLSTGVAFLLQSIAQQHTTSSEAAIVGSGESIFGAIGAIMLLHEIPTMLAGVGAVLMCSGILIVQVASLPARH
jgi:drug/metabolite transporter (DMT)-like permease